MGMAIQFWHIWIAFGACLLLNQPGCHLVSGQNGNRVGGHGSMPTQLPMVEPGQPQETQTTKKQANPSTNSPTRAFVTLPHTAPSLSSANSSLPVTTATTLNVTSPVTTHNVASAVATHNVTSAVTSENVTTVITENVMSTATTENVMSSATVEHGTSAVTAAVSSPPSSTLLQPATTAATVENVTSITPTTARRVTVVTQQTSNGSPTVNQLPSTTPTPQLTTTVSSPATLSATSGTGNGTTGVVTITRSSEGDQTTNVSSTTLDVSSSQPTMPYTLPTVTPTTEKRYLTSVTTNATSAVHSATSALTRPQTSGSSTVNATTRALTPFITMTTENKTSTSYVNSSTYGSTIPNYTTTTTRSTTVVATVTGSSHSGGPFHGTTESKNASPTATTWYSPFRSTAESRTTTVTTTPTESRTTSLTTTPWHHVLTTVFNNHSPISQTTKAAGSATPTSIASSLSPARWFTQTTPNATLPNSSTPAPTPSTTSPQTTVSMASARNTVATTVTGHLSSTNANTGHTTQARTVRSTNSPLPLPLTTHKSKPLTGTKPHLHTTPPATHPSSYPPLLTSPVPVTANASYRLPAYVQLHLRTHWLKFCPESAGSLQSLTDYARMELGLPSYHMVSVTYLNVQYNCPVVRVGMLERRSSSDVIPVDFAIAINNTYYENSTRQVGMALVADPSALQKDISFEIVSVLLLALEKVATPAPQLPGENQGVVLGTSLTVCMLVLGAVLSFAGMKIHGRRKLHSSQVDRFYFDGKQLQDTLSDTHQREGALSPGGALPAPTYREYFLASINRGLVMDDEDGVVEETGNDETLPSHVLTDSALAKFYSYKEAIAEEFENLPGHQNTLNDSKKMLPVAMSIKSRANTSKSPDKTKVPMPTSPDHGKSDVILDASFIRGYNSSHCRYIAARVSGADSSDAFWRTIWEQQSRTIICLFSPYDLGKGCPHYWPTVEGGPGAQLFGSILVTLKGGASGEHYFTSSLLVRNVEKTLCRPVTHYWFTNWTEAGLPVSSQALMSMLLQVHNTHQESYGPVIVHCSDGVGRTGMVIATDINMQRLEASHTVDIPRTVSTIRQDRGQGVLTAAQYAFIYKTLYEFSRFLSSDVVKEPSDTESVLALESEDHFSSGGREDSSSQGTTASSRASSYLGDLSAAVRRQLARRFPSLGIAAPSSPGLSPKAHKSGGEFVVFNSQNSVTLDRSFVSGLTDSGKRDDSNSLDLSLCSPLDQTSFSIEDEVFEACPSDKNAVLPNGDKPLGVKQISMTGKSSGRVTSKPGSSANQSKFGKGYVEPRGKICLTNGSSEESGGIDNPAFVHEHSPTHSGMHAGYEGPCIDNNTSRLELEAHGQPSLTLPTSLPGQHEAFEASYPGDLNPFGASSRPSSSDLPGVIVPSEQETAFRTMSARTPTSARTPASDAQPKASEHPLPHSDPIPPSQQPRQENTYPRNINPFDVSEAPWEDVPSPTNGRVPGDTLVSVPHFEEAGLVRQGTYPKGKNPFDKCSDPEGHCSYPHQVNSEKGFHLKPVHRDTPTTNELLNTSASKNAVAAHNKFVYDWMDDAEESFT